MPDPTNGLQRAGDRVDSRSGGGIFDGHRNSTSSSGPTTTRSGKNTIVTSDRRAKIVVVLLVLLGLYTAFFSIVVSAIGRDKGTGGAGTSSAADGYATDIACSPNWFVLGAVSRCTATVVKPDGTRYPFSSFANELSAADVGHEVAMYEYKTKNGRVPTGRFGRAETIPTNGWGMVFGFFGSIVFVMVVPMVMWPRKPKQAPTPAAAPLTDIQRQERVHKLRGRSWVFIGAAPVVAYMAYVVFGFAIVAKANQDGAVHQPVEGTGVVQGCSRDWSYLGQLWSCEVTVTLPEFGATITSPTGESPFTTTVHYSQLAPKDIGTSVPMTSHPTVNPFGHGFVWAVAEQPREHPAAKVVAMFGLFGSLILLGVAQDSRRRVKRILREASQRELATSTA